MRHVKGDIVLFTSEGSGTQLNGNPDDGFLGFYSTGWDMSDFDLFKGSVTLSNYIERIIL